MSSLWPEPARARTAQQKLDDGCIEGPLPMFQSRLEPNTGTLALDRNSERGPSLSVLFDAFAKKDA